MKQTDFKKLIPHLTAIAIFLLVTVIFCKPSLEADVVLKQNDVAGWQGMSHLSFLYKEIHGHFPLWLTSMFSGMPAYQVAMEGAWSPLGIIDHAIQLWLPQPMNFFYLACICFYFLCICLKIRPYAAILGALAFAYCSFSPIIITAGHNTQMLALAYTPAVIGAVVLLFDKKYFAGFTLTALFTALQIAQGHQQISYYLFLVLGFMTVSYVIRFIKNADTAHLFKSLGLVMAAGIIGVAVNALILMTTYDYAKESKRGGQLVMDNKENKADKVADGKTAGLSKDYAFMWSYGKAETMSLMFPGVNGYGLHYAEREGDQYLFPKLDENSHVVKFLTDKLNVPEDQAANIALQQSGAIYWGTQPGTNGPIYLGAIVCFLFIFGMFYLDGRHKWWIFSACIFGMLLALGKNLPGFNYLMFDYFPLYNKFRVPTMTLVIPQILFPIMASLVLNKLYDADDLILGWKKFKSGLFATVVVFAGILFFYVSSDFSNENRQRTNLFNQLTQANDPSIDSKLATLEPAKDNQLYEGMIANLKGSPDAQKSAREFVSAVKADRASMLLGDITRSLLLVLIAAVFIALYLKKKIHAMMLIIGITLASTIDLMSFGMKYLNANSFDSKEKYEAAEFPLTAADKQILEDKDPNFRVWNTSSLEESKTSYYHNSIGGYHPAKLGIYDDLMAYQLHGRPNMSVVNMLNAKYVLQQQGNETVAMKNPGAMGNAWFVKAVKFVNGPVAEMKALDNFEPADTAVVDEKFKSMITAFTAPDSADFIRMKTFDNDAIVYESSTSADHIALFSEVYYKDWKATIDGKPADHFKANYVLRGMLIPAGKHTIEFKFEPAVFYMGKNISNIATWFLMLMMAVFIFISLKKKPAEKDLPEA